MTIVTTKPGVLALNDAAAYLSLSPSLLQQQVQKTDDFPKPVQLSARRVGWLTSELDDWLMKRPRSDLAPPEGGSQRGGGKRAADSS